MECSLPGSSVHGTSQKYWSGLPFVSPGHLPNSGIEVTPPALAGRFLITEPPRKPTFKHYILWCGNILSWWPRYDHVCFLQEVQVLQVYQGKKAQGSTSCAFSLDQHSILRIYSSTLWLVVYSFVSHTRQWAPEDTGCALFIVLSQVNVSDFTNNQLPKWTQALIIIKLGKIKLWAI